MRYVLHLLLIFSFVACLDNERVELKVFEGTEIVAVKMEHRFQYTPTSPDDPNIKGLPQMRVVPIDDVTITTDVDGVNDLENVPEGVEISEITLTPKRPEVEADLNFTAEEQAKVTNSYIVVVTTISNGATVTPMGDSPKLGTFGDFSKPRKYRVTAANGDTKDWIITVNPFVD